MKEKEPKWYLTASSAKRDFENSNIIYRDVSVRVKGIPIVYLPYLRMPDPSIDRVQGFSARSCDYLKFRNRNKNTVFCAYGLEPRYPINTIFFNKNKNNYIAIGKIFTVVI